MSKPFTYFEGMLLMAWAAVFNDEVEKHLDDPGNQKTLGKSKDLMDKVRALVEGFDTSTYEWADGIWKRKS